MKKFNHSKIAPKNIHDCLYVSIDSNNNISGFIPTFTPSIASLNNEDWYKFLKTLVITYQRGNYYVATGSFDVDVNVLQDHIFKNYSYRPFLDSIFDLIDIYNWDWKLQDFVDRTTDMNMLDDEIIERCKNTFIKNQYKYAKLWEALTVEFNPLWNVDGVEETVRTLERDGSITNAKSGNDETAKSGNDALVKSGTVTDAESGTTALAHTGTITTTDSGTDTTAYEGSETDTKNGVHTSAVTGGEIVTEKEATTDSQTWLNVKQTSTTFGDGTNENSKTTTDTDTNITNVHAYTNNRRDIETKNLTNQQTNANTDTTTHGKTDTTTYNNTDTQNYNSKDKTTYNSSNTETIDTLDTERTTYERHGNIGVTTTTQLLTEFVEYAKLVDFVDIVARDILETITMGVY